MASSLRMPIAVAAAKGVSAVATTSTEQRVVLTNPGHPVAIVDSAERIDEDLRRVREATRAFVESTADAVLERRPAKLDLNDVCLRLGVDVERVRARARELAANAE